MTTPPAPRRVRVERTGPGRFCAVNERAGRITFGKGEGDDFTPTELLLAAIGGCTAIDVDILTSRRADPDSFAVTVDAGPVPDGPDGDAAREVLPEAVQRSHDRICTVGRTVELGTPIATRIV
jgi:uncharacterized OsmC-like protein